MKLTFTHSAQRDLVRGDYIVRYIVRSDEVCILCIWHGKEE